MQPLLLLATDYHLDLALVFKGSPFIYSTLLALSLLSFTLCLYSLLTLKKEKLMPPAFIKELRTLVIGKRYDLAFVNCQRDGSFLGAIVASALKSRKHGYHGMREAMETEGRRCGVILWQRISILNEIATISPMIGLLGTILGLFLAFYDVHRTEESLTTIFDGLGLSIGTTVGGLLVAISAMIFHTILKFRITRLLSQLENEAYSFVNLIEV